jgi:replication factor A2
VGVEEAAVHSWLFFIKEGNNMQASGFASNANNGATPQSKQAPRRSTNPLRPVTIKMITTSQRVGDGVLVIDGKEVGTVSVVGRITTVEAATGVGATAKSHAYKITDGSGQLTVRHWLDQSATDVAPELEVGSFVRATGTVKTFQDQPTLTGNVRAMEDMNEMTFHFLDTILTHLRIKNGDRQQVVPDSAAGSTAAAQPTPFAVAGGSMEEAMAKIIHQNNARGAGMDAAILHQQLVQAGFEGSMRDTKDKIAQLVGGGTWFVVGGDKYAC